MNESIMITYEITFSSLATHKKSHPYIVMANTPIEATLKVAEELKLDLNTTEFYSVEMSRP